MQIKYGISSSLRQKLVSLNTKLHKTTLGQTYIHSFIEFIKTVPLNQSSLKN